MRRMVTASELLSSVGGALGGSRSYPMANGSSPRCSDSSLREGKISRKTHVRNGVFLTSKKEGEKALENTPSERAKNAPKTGKIFYPVF